LQTLTFTAVDTVSADFQYNINYGCTKDTVFFSHNGTHDVSTWMWAINTLPVTTQTTSAIFSASSSNSVQLLVSNGVCTDVVSKTIDLNNEVKASFTCDDIICPEDNLAVTNTSTGTIDSWRWNFGTLGTSFVKDPPPFLFPTLSREIKYPVKLTVSNLALGCSDSIIKMITVLDFCSTDIPTAFTPNNDGLNDTFGPHNALKADNYYFRIYNRWGQLIFESKEWKKRWDGKFNGSLQGTGAFVWMLTYTNRTTGQKVLKKGTVTLIR
jgi:gliding motility-associated-like protein